MNDRRSYSNLMRLPAWGLFDCHDQIVASIRAKDAWTARDLFMRYGYEGVRVKRL